MALISIAPAQVVEGPTESVRRLCFAVSLSAPTTQEVTVTYETAVSTAKNAAAETDYFAASGTLTIAAGQMSGFIFVDIAGDAEREGNEVFNLVLSNPQGAGFSKGGESLTAVGTIVDDELVISLGNGKITEGTAGNDREMAFTVTLSAPAQQDISIPYTTADATGKSLATAGEDYFSVADTLVIPVGESSGVIRVSIVGDGAKEDSETFALTLSDPVGAGFAKGTTLSATGTIVDATPTLSVNAPTVIEGNLDDDNRQLQFVVSLSAPAAQDVTFDYATTSEGTAKAMAAAGEDYLAVTDTVTIPAGETSAVITVDVIGDAVRESTETVNLGLSNPNGAGFAKNAASLTASGTILDNSPTITVTAPTITEGSGTDKRVMYFPVTLSSPALQDVSIRYNTAETTTKVATAGTDFESISNGLLEIPAGQVAGYIAVEILADAAQEGTETFSLVLSEPTGAGFAKGSSLSTLGTILDDESTATPGTPKLTLSAAKVTEGLNGTQVFMRFPVLLSAPASGPVTVRYKTADLAGDSAAIAGKDYKPMSGVLTFDRGETFNEIVIPVLSDKKVEADETFGLTIYNPKGANLLAGDSVNVVGTIVDHKPVITALGASVAEGNVVDGVRDINYLRFPVQLSEPATDFVTVRYATADGTAIAGSDYAAATGKLVFSPGDTLQYAYVKVYGGLYHEGDESLSLTLSQPRGASLANASGITVTGTIFNDEPVISASTASVGEGNQGDERVLHFPVSLSTATTSTVTVRYQTILATGANSAVAGKDYVPVKGVLVFEPGELQATVDVTVKGDALKELDELVSLRLYQPKGAGLPDGKDLFVNGTVMDDEPVISILPASIGEGDKTESGTIQFPVMLSSPSTEPVTVHYRTLATAEVASAKPGVDFQAVSKSLTIPAGETFALIDVTVFGDNRPESNETFVLQLDHPRGAGFGGAVSSVQVIGTIIDNEPSIIA